LFKANRDVIFWTQQNLGGTKNYGVHCPRMTPMATGLRACCVRRLLNFSRFVKRV